MTPQFVFSVASISAIAGWVLLFFAVLFKWNRLLTLVGQVWPVGFSAAYALFIVLFFANAPGGFDTLEHVQLLFTAPWAALTGWLHYLAFDLLIGCWLAGHVLQHGLPRWGLIILLPLTFLFGPIGYLGFKIFERAFQKVRVTK